MAATMRWNVRIVDYLMERNVDPTVKNVYGFTAGRLAEIKNLKTISSMLRNYE
jgi:ankyrin repeat protein